MARLVLRLDLRRAGFELAVDEVLELEGISALFGPSGCGKTTLLRALAGLEPQVRGRIVLDDEVWLGPPLRAPLPAHRRGVGLVFQDARLFDHLGVEGNLRYAERRARGADGPAIAWDEVLRALDLQPLLARRPASLSGGERQRVAIGRTLLARPRLLLMDEPLAALDAQRKAEILPYVERLPATFGVPVLYVTHDMAEVARLAQRLVLMDRGRVLAQGPLDAVLEALDGPEFEALEPGVVLPAQVLGIDAAWGLLHLQVAGGEWVVPAPPRAPAPGSALRLRVRARDVSLATVRPSGLSVRNVLPGTLLALRERGAMADALVDIGGARLRARLTRHAAAELALAPGAPVFALVKGVALEAGA